MSNEGKFLLMMTSLTSPEFKGALKAEQMQHSPLQWEDTGEGLRVHSQIALTVPPLSGQTQWKERAAHRAAMAHAATAREPAGGLTRCCPAMPGSLPVPRDPGARTRTEGPVPPGLASRSSADSLGAQRRHRLRPGVSAAPCPGDARGAGPKPVAEAPEDSRAEPAMQTRWRAPRRARDHRAPAPWSRGSPALWPPASPRSRGSTRRRARTAHLRGPRPQPHRRRQHRGQRRLTCRAAPLCSASPQRRSRRYPTSIFSRFKGKSDQLFAGTRIPRPPPSCRSRSGGLSSPAFSRSPLRPSRPSAPPAAARSARLLAPPAATARAP